MEKYDLAIIGSGPCGYVAAIRAAQLGLKVCIFEKDRLGGVCLNWGCIPTKALYVSSRVLYDIKRSSEFGIEVKDYALDFPKVIERKNNIVKELCAGIETLLKARKITIINQKAQIENPAHLKTSDSLIETKNILIATGSLPFEIPGIKFDSKYILSSTDILELNQVPESLIIIGGGVIGCEFASIFQGFGSKVTIIEMMERLLPLEDEEISKKLEQIFKKKGMDIFTKTKVEQIEKNNGATRAILSNGNTVSGEKTLVCVGRSPNLSGIDIDRLGIERKNSWVKTDSSFKTNIGNIYAAGDVIGGVLLAHVASREGCCAIENMCGEKSELDYNAVPNCIFTHPEVASVGMSEARAKEKGIDVVSRRFLFSAIGKAHVLSETDGFIKFVVEKNTDKILGAQIMGAHATELIAELIPCVQFGITSEKLASVIHAHPTLSEIVQEVSESVHNRAIHGL